MTSGMLVCHALKGNLKLLPRNLWAMSQIVVGESAASAEASAVWVLAGSV